MRRMACQEVAKAKIFERFASTFYALVPMSVTLMEKSGLRAEIAIVSAVEVRAATKGTSCFSALTATSFYFGCSFNFRKICSIRNDYKPSF